MPQTVDMKTLSRSLLAIVSLVFATGCNQGPPTDNKLISTYQNHRQDFARMGEMIVKHPFLYSVNANTSPLEHSIERSSARIEFDELRQKIGVPPRGRHFSSKGKVHIEIWEDKNNTYHQWYSKGFCYFFSTNAGASFTNVVRENSSTRTEVFQQLEGPWYIYSDRYYTEDQR